jgi:Antibiotic biosynthesis monooxygenase
MKYLTLGIHHPKQGHTQDLLDATQKIAEQARKLDGLVDTGAWLDEATGRVIMMSLWESEAAAMRARPVLGPLVKDFPFSEWESQPAEQLVNLTRAV